jgi:signal transduction histidine kinase
MAVLWVEDTGIGIPPDELPCLFQRFHRGRNASAYPGSGLGLAIVKAIAERHGGQVGVESTESGTRFSLWLPLPIVESTRPD